MLNQFFTLHGLLNRSQKITLSIIGIVLVIIGWFGASELLSKKLITQDEQFVGKEYDLSDVTYFKNDSLLIAHYDKLESLNQEKLTAYGLTKKKVYPLLPSPIKVVESYSELVKQDDLIGNVFYSIKLNIAGYIVAIVLSILIGFILGLIPLFRGLFSQLFDSFRFIPLTAVTGIFIMWFGLGSEMKIYFLAFGIMVYLIPVVVQRIDDVNKVYIQTTFTIGATNWQTIKSVYIPFTFSKLIDDVRVLTAISWTYITIAEMLNKGGGIGELIWTAKRQSRIDKAFAILIVIVLIGIIQDRLFSFLDHLLFPHKYIKNKR